MVAREVSQTDVTGVTDNHSHHYLHGRREGRGRTEGGEGWRGGTEGTEGRKRKGEGGEREGGGGQSGGEGGGGQREGRDGRDGGEEKEGRGRREGGGGGQSGGEGREGRERDRRGKEPRGGGGGGGGGGGDGIIIAFIGYITLHNRGSITTWHLRCYITLHNTGGIPLTQLVARQLTSFQHHLSADQQKTKTAIKLGRALKGWPLSLLHIHEQWDVRVYNYSELLQVAAGGCDVPKYDYLQPALQWVWLVLPGPTLAPITSNSHCSGHSRDFPRITVENEEYVWSVVMQS